MRSGLSISVFAGKTRPALVVSIAFGDQDRALITVVPHTTSLRGSTFEIEAFVPFLKPGAFLVQGVTTFPPIAALRRLGTVRPEVFEKVFDGLLHWLGKEARDLPAHLVSNFDEGTLAVAICEFVETWFHNSREKINHDDSHFFKRHCKMCSQLL